MTQNKTATENYSLIKKEVYDNYQKNKVVEEFDYNSYLQFLKKEGVNEYDVEGLTILFNRGKLDPDEYFYLRDKWLSVRNAADAK